jgi:Putative DNA-binding domain/EC042_2821-lke REase
VDVDRFVERARIAKRESKYLEFKEQFNPKNDGEWIELVKDFAALANSGGGAVVIGAHNDGSPSGVDVRSVLDLDGAKISDKLFRFTGGNFDDFEVHEVQRDGNTLAAIVIGSAGDAPLVFVQAGNYSNPQGKQKKAFARGAVYFRHGAKSEPATSADLGAFIERRLDQVRDVWLGGIRRVVTAPRGAEIVAIERRADEQGEPIRIRITTDEDAPLYGRINPDDTHPYRQTELIEAVNKKLPGRARINQWDVQTVRRIFEIDPKSRPDFAYQGKFDPASRYSVEFVEWLIDQFAKDKRFFETARQRYAELLHSKK